ncbi:hypothetical protein T01_11382 [Trichinella spiralis]|uniref:Uncharacterized protein n=1 Tax=Trichinella spiralis TaxID=6334 RepID=A0A0V1AIK6_TRISP|nr:hypothetical protein T01_11382 [Trichinella spiralis]
MSVELIFIPIGRKMKKNRLAQNKEILHKTSQFQRIPHYNVKYVSYIKIQPSWSRFKGVPDGLLSCVLR